SPDAAAWKQQLAKGLDSIGDRAILVGHSLGGTILINFLAEAEPQKSVAGIFLVAAPFIGAGGWESEDLAPPLDIGPVLPKDAAVYLYHGRDDEIVPFAHVELYARALPRAVIRRLDERNHQLNEDLVDVARDIERLD